MCGRRPVTTTTSSSCCALFIVLLCFLSTAHARPYELNNDPETEFNYDDADGPVELSDLYRLVATKLQNVADADEDAAENTAVESANHALAKRQAFSFNNNLSALEAWMEARRSRRHDAARSFLLAIGKRDSSRGPGLSVGLSVEAINNMLRAQRDRASANRASGAFSRLQIIGKKRKRSIADH